MLCVCVCLKSWSAKGVSLSPSLQWAETRVQTPRYIPKTPTGPTGFYWINPKNLSPNFTPILVSPATNNEKDIVNFFFNNFVN